MLSLDWALSFIPSLDMPSLDWAVFAPSLLMPSLDWAFFGLSLPMLSLDWALFMPPDSLFIGAAGGALRSEGGELCWVAGACAKASPLPAISAAASTDIIKRLGMEYLLTWLHCPRQQRSEGDEVP